VALFGTLAINRAFDLEQGVDELCVNLGDDV
jgi:hypothetical protein